MRGLDRVINDLEDIWELHKMLAHRLLLLFMSLALFDGSLRHLEPTLNDSQI